MAELNEGERALLGWQYGGNRWCGGFQTALMTAMAKADTANLERFSACFPEHYAALRDFHEDSSYWPNLKTRAGIMG